MVSVYPAPAVEQVELFGLMYDRGIYNYAAMDQDTSVHMFEHLPHIVHDPEAGGFWKSDTGAVLNVSMGGEFTYCKWDTSLIAFANYATIK
jgi:hypothetical protein